MRRLTLIRHAEASQAAPGQRDFDRLLNARGLHDATQLGHHLATLPDWQPDYFLTSTAARTQHTAHLITQASRHASHSIQQELRLYEATTTAILEVIKGLPTTAQHTCIIGHNPGMENITNLLVGAQAISGFQTSGVAILQLNITDWTQAAARCGKLLNYLDLRRSIRPIP
jgi:phosphohistidine phosphatase